MLGALRRAQQVGFLGEPPLEHQIAHAIGFAHAVEAARTTPAPRALLDLGSGGGLPGLVLAARWLTSRIVLLDANQRRCQALRQAVTACGWGERVRVVEDRAELAGHQADLRAAHDLVVARSFGPPAVVAECAAPFLEVGGLLVVSEPPLPASGDTDEISLAGAPRRSGHPDRWPSDQLEVLGLVPFRFISDGAGYQLLRQVLPCPDRYARRVGVPAKRPLF